MSAEGGDPDQTAGSIASDKSGYPVIGPVFQKNLSFKIAMSLWAGVWRKASSQVNLLVNLFSKLYISFILQWIAFIFGRDEVEDQ